FKLGYLEQDPKLDESKTVKENVMEGLGEINDLLMSFQKVSEELCDPDLTPEKMDQLIEKQGRIQDQIEAKDGWSIDTMVEQAMEALRCPPGESKVTHLSGGEKRRVALTRLLL